MASEATLAKRSEKEKARAAKRDAKAKMAFEMQQARDRQERGQVAAQFITSLARDIYADRVVLAGTAGALGEFTKDELYAHYKRQAHSAMDAAIAFVRASNEYDDRGQVPENAPPIIAEEKPAEVTDAP